LSTHSNRSLTDADRDRVLGDDLITKIEAYKRNPTVETMNAFCAALIGRCASVNAAIVVDLHKRILALEAIANTHHGDH